ncbi:DUF6289 family protein [Lysobacter sp. CA199]|uniref:DUF6289 family protein n=1 Tax=Lysobacter sp. CA199 TaxID=3455608 RepID=UPI003F8D1C53
MLRTRKTVFKAALVLGLVAIAGTAFARYPILGEEWAEWTRYDSSGNAVGGGRIECDGSVQTWGNAGAPTGLTLHRCN